MESAKGRLLTRNPPPVNCDGQLHPAWLQFIRYCAEMAHGEIDKLKIQDGLPLMAESTTKKVKFSP
jgi:hypothetical protein